MEAQANHKLPILPSGTRIHHCPLSQPLGSFRNLYTLPSGTDGLRSLLTQETTTIHTQQKNVQAHVLHCNLTIASTGHDHDDITVHGAES